MVDNQFADEVTQLCQGLSNTLVAKNSDYGASFVQNGEREAAGPSPLNDNETAILHNLSIRVQDKSQRFENLLYDTESEVDESLADTAMDAAGYWLLMAWTLKHYSKETV